MTVFKRYQQNPCGRCGRLIPRRKREKWVFDTKTSKRYHHACYDAIALVRFVSRHPLPIKKEKPE